MNNKHKYQYNIDFTLNTAPSNVVKFVGENKKVIEFGCGPGSITKCLVEKNKCLVTGVEFDLDAINIVKKYCTEIFKIDLNGSEWEVEINNKNFDVVVAADVLELLIDPLSNLKKMSGFLNNSGYLVISLPLITHASIMACLFNGTFNYGNFGLLDKTHLRFFGLNNIEDLFQKAGLKIIDVAYITKLPEDTEFADIWAMTPRYIQSTFKISPYSDVYQVVLKAVPIDRVDQQILLIPEKFKFSYNVFLNRYKLKFSKFIPCKVKDLIKNFRCNKK